MTEWSWARCPDATGRVGAITDRGPAWNTLAVHRIRLGGDDLTVLLDTSTGVPAIVHWGRDPGPGDDIDALLVRPVAPAGLDAEAPLTLVPAATDGFTGRPGLELLRAEGPCFPRLEGRWAVTGDSLWFSAADGECGVEVEGTVVVGDVVEIDVTVTNTGTDPLGVAHVGVTVPVPDRVDELLRLGGQWAREFQVVRTAWTSGTQLVENRRGRTSHDAPPVLFCGPTGFSEQGGDVRAVHLAWSGNHTVRADRLADGRRCLQAGELLLAGEVALGPGERYRAPTVLLSAGQGMTACSRRFHAHLRRTLRATPRPVVLNTWEAVYFDHDIDRLRALADRAAAVGVERFVLDDGWFGGRRDDRRGLGDWWVSPDVYPDGLGPLIDHVRSRGMDFGIWVEPEMVNPDSDLYREHPDWVLGDPAVLGRDQLVLDLGRPDCRDTIFERLDRLLGDHDIAFVKWDMNRDVVGAGAHRQTLAVYGLLDALRARHPGIEFESCASGGGRADAGILRWTDRIWTSDCNDPLERQTIQRGFSLVFPPEVMGAHIGPPRAHTTGRSSRLAFRAATALFGHLGIEWDLLGCSPRELEKLAAWIRLHKELRPLLHGGDVVRLDHPDVGTLAHGVVSTDRSDAVFCLAQLARSETPVPPPLVLAGLDGDRTYLLERISMPGDPLGLARTQPGWLAEGVRAGGRALMTTGVQPPTMLAESALLLRLRAVS